MSRQQHFRYSFIGVALLLLASSVAAVIGTADKISDVRGTKHNLSAAAAGSTYVSGTATFTVPARTLMASTETQVCVFCHTPHGATSGSVAPLWNRKLSTTATYIPYTSSSIEATDLNQPGGSSKLCLSCHDGAMAIGEVNVLNGASRASPNPEIEMKVNGTITSGAKMPSGSGATTGFTRNLGTNLSNDHPISFTYDASLGVADGELRGGPTGPVVVNRVAGTGLNNHAIIPLENNQVQCASCHDPHIRDKNEAANGNAKFLRMNRFQVTTPAGGAFDTANDIICLACHDKAGKAWAFSAHANKDVADETYSAGTATTLREVPTGTPVWQVACLNCHDTHTVQGARRLLREGTSTTGTGSIQDGLATTTTADFTKSAIENTCYLCHDSASTLISPLTKVPPIKNDFALSYRMPINSADQAPTTSEVHDIGTGVNATTKTSGNGKDFVESKENLGFGALGNRHAECTDCHNPHRVIKAQNGLPGILSSANTNDLGGTHQHDGTNYVHTNVISGVLRGAWGVEPAYPDASFASMPNSFVERRGDPGSNTLATAEALVGTKPVTREYQICLKCHSNYGYADNNTYPNDATGRPQIVAGKGRTSPADVTALGHSNFTSYTNQAKEFQAPSGHTGEGTSSTSSGAAAGYAANNHRSWHPVMGATGRTAAVRGGLSASNWTAPWSNSGGLGVQTMYCSDCHGSKVTAAGTVRPDGNGTSAAPTEDGSPWGPHGSSNPFLLKGLWNKSTGTGQETDGLCFKCHNAGIYTGNSPARTGFWINADRSSGNDGHKVHRDKISGNSLRCNWCHVAVPHGWKNKALLVNLDDLGPEVNQTAGTKAAAGVYTNGPYYRNAMLRVKTFGISGQWQINYCGAAGQDSRSWMQNTCNSPP